MMRNTENGTKFVSKSPVQQKKHYFCNLLIFVGVIRKNSIKMKSKITTVMMVLLAAFITLGGTTSCKSKKRLAREAAEAEYNARVEQAIADLNAILDDETLWTLAMVWRKEWRASASGPKTAALRQRSMSRSPMKSPYPLMTLKTLGSPTSS